MQQTNFIFTKKNFLILIKVHFGVKINWKYGNFPVLFFPNKKKEKREKLNNFLLTLIEQKTILCVKKYKCEVFWDENKQMEI